MKNDSGKMALELDGEELAIWDRVVMEKSFRVPSERAIEEADQVILARRERSTFR